MGRETTRLLPTRWSIFLVPADHIENTDKILIRSFKLIGLITLYTLFETTESEITDKILIRSFNFRGSGGSH